jgi:hypothetical protein
VTNLVRGFGLVDTNQTTGPQQRSHLDPSLPVNTNENGRPRLANVRKPKYFGVARRLLPT